MFAPNKCVRVSVCVLLHVWVLVPDWKIKQILSSLKKHVYMLFTLWEVGRDQHDIEITT